jgi:hypothetical protein
MLLVPPDLAAEITADVTHSALPNAPQRPDPEPRLRAARVTIARPLRAGAESLLRLADRLDRRFEPT